MLKKRLQIKDSQIRKSLRWNILRLLRLDSRTRKELIDKLNDMYLGYWPVTHQLVGTNLDPLRKEGLISYSNEYKITEDGLGALARRENESQKHDMRLFSKETCANYSLWGNVGLSALEFAIEFLSGSIGLIADAIHTAVDILASAITWIDIKINKEAQASVIGGIVLFGIGGFIVYESITKIFEGAAITFQAVALATIIVNIGINGIFSYYKFYVGGRTRSIALVADAYHTKTDI
jgi:DNA-binding PadR family transcriptional regulator